MSEAEIKAYLAAIGKRGGEAATGKKKARTTAQARKAALAMWAKRRKHKQTKPTDKTKE